MNKSRKYFKKSDLLLIALVLIVSAAGFFMLSLKGSEKSPKTAEIRVNGTLFETVDLEEISTPFTLTVEGNFPVTLELSSDGVRFLSSECPDSLCIHSGLITSGGSAACLPAGVSVSVSADSSQVDAVVG